MGRKEGLDDVRLPRATEFVTSLWASDNAGGNLAVQPFGMIGEGSEAGRRLSSLRKTYKKACPVFDSEFEGIARRGHDRPACQVKAYPLRMTNVSVRHGEDD